MHARFQVAVADHGVLGVTGDEQYLQPRAALPRGVGHLPAIHAPRQTDVADQQVDAHVGLQQSQPGAGIRRLQGRVA